MIVVSNTSPIINLAQIGHLDLLRQVYGQIIIPPAVYHEIVVAGVGLPGAQTVQTAAWIATQPLTNPGLVASLRMVLDAGEAEAIALAASLPADLLLIDERRGRMQAGHYQRRNRRYPGRPTGSQRAGVDSGG